MDGGFTASFRLLPKQAEFIQVPNHEIVTDDYAIYQGGFGAGKTWAGCLLGILLCMQTPNLLMLSVAATYTQLEDTTIRMYRQLLDEMGFKYGTDYQFWGATGKARIKFSNGAEIIFKHADKDAIRSITAGVIQVEEISQISKETFIELCGRLRQPGIKRRRLYGHTNPQPNRGWIHELFVQNNPGLIEAEGANGEKAVIQYRRVIAASTDNPYLPPGYIENLRHQFDEDYFKIYVLGHDGDYMAGLLTKGWTFANEEPVEYDERQVIYLSCDFNVDPMCWVLAHRINGEFHFFDEIFIENTNTEESIEEFISRYGKHRTGIVITGDASGHQRRSSSAMIGGATGTDYRIMKNALSHANVRNVSMDIPGANPLIGERVAAWNAAICSRDGLRRVRVNVNKCPKLMYNIYNLRYKPGTSIISMPTLKELEESREAKSLGHMFDAASYLVHRYAPIRNTVMPGTFKSNTVMRSVPFRPNY